MTNFTGTSGDDTFTGGALSDSFDLTAGGNDTATGGNGYDYFYMGSTLTAADHIDGGAGYDYVYLDGDYSSQLVLGPGTITHIEGIYLTAGHSYNLKTDDANVTGGNGLSVAGYVLGPTDTLTFDGSAETFSPFSISDGQGNDVIKTGGGNDGIYLNQGGADTVNAGDGSDYIYGYDKITSADRIDGGSGYDYLYLDGDYSGGLTFGAASLKNVESISLSSGHDYKLKFADANVANDQQLYVYAGNLGAADKLNLTATAETGGQYYVAGGAGADSVTTGGGDDYLYGYGGADKLNGGGGDDTLVGGVGKDTLTGGTGSDVFSFDDGDTPAATPDLITDLTNGDVIDVSNIDANTTVDFDQSFTMVSSFSHTPGELIVTYDAGSDVTSYLMDVNGDAVADDIVQASGHHTGFANFYL